MRPGLEPGRSLTVRSPLAGGRHLQRRHSLPLLPSTSTSATPSGCSKTSSTLCTFSAQPSRDLAEALRLFPFVPGPPALTPPTTRRKLYPPNLSISRTPSPLPPLTPSPSPSPAPNPSALSPSDPASTIWAEYLITHGGYGKTLLGPVRTVKKPRRYRLTPEQRRDEDEWTLTQIPSKGKNLTRSAYSKFLAHGTPAPEGYAYNLGAQYVPMPIRGPDGRIWPARFTKVEFTDNPTVHGFRAGSPTPYSDQLYATPFFDLRQRPRYAVADVWFLSTRYPYRDEVDLGIKALGDLTAQAEVRRYRGLEYQLNQLQNELIELENRIGTRQMEKDQCIRRLEQADVLQRIVTKGGYPLMVPRITVRSTLQPSMTSTFPLLPSRLISFGSCILTIWGMTAWMRRSVRLAIVR
jgi:hypothetical protein